MCLIDYIDLKEEEKLYGEFLAEKCCSTMLFQIVYQISAFSFKVATMCTHGSKGTDANLQRLCQPRFQRGLNDHWEYFSDQATLNFLKSTPSPPVPRQVA